MTVEKAASIDAFGIVDFEQRTIDIVGTGPMATRWQTFWHEAVHVALWDSGTHNILTEQQNEAVADAVGAFLTQMMLAGQLKVSNTWEKDQPGDGKTPKR